LRSSLWKSATPSPPLAIVPKRTVSTAGERVGVRGPRLPLTPHPLFGQLLPHSGVLSCFSTPIVGEKGSLTTLSRSVNVAVKSGSSPGSQFGVRTRPDALTQPTPFATCTRSGNPSRFVPEKAGTREHVANVLSKCDRLDGVVPHSIPFITEPRENGCFLPRLPSLNRGPTYFPAVTNAATENPEGPKNRSNCRVVFLRRD
jgi:hypothetical protein